jgi:predicted SAM-dependent methyltransferase
MTLRPIPESTRHPLVARLRRSTRVAATVSGARVGEVLHIWSRRRAARVLGRAQGPLRLCLGSGAAPIDGWTNIDIRSPADVLLDLRYGIPLDRESVDFIYSERLIEHFSLEDGLRLMAECFRILKPEGVLRFATPDLEELVKEYSTDWQRHDWVHWPTYEWIDSGVRMLNYAVRGWGHLYIYAYEEMRLRLTQAGFSHITRAQLGSSSHTELCGLETRADSKLIVEAQPRDPLTNAPAASDAHTTRPR